MKFPGQKRKTYPTKFGFDFQLGQPQKLINLLNLLNLNYNQKKFSNTIPSSPIFFKYPFLITLNPCIHKGVSSFRIQFHELPFHAQKDCKLAYEEFGNTLKWEMKGHWLETLIQ